MPPSFPYTKNSINPRDHLFYVISRRNCYRTVDWYLVPGPFHLENCANYLYMKTKVEITKHSFHLKGWVGGFFYTKVIMSRNHMQSCEMIIKP